MSAKIAKNPSEGFGPSMKLSALAALYRKLKLSPFSTRYEHEANSEEPFPEPENQKGEDVDLRSLFAKTETASLT